MGLEISVDIVSAKKTIYSGSAKLVTVSGQVGYMGIQYGHAPLLSFLRPGLIRLDHGDEAEEEVFYISGGILEVQPQMITILADEAERALDLDEAEARKAEEHARKILTDKSAEYDYAKGLAELAKATAQLKAIRRLRERK